MEQGLSNPQALPSSHMHDSVLCTEVADVNWDGENELVLGTYGKVSELPCPYIAELWVVLYIHSGFRVQFIQVHVCYLCAVL